MTSKLPQFILASSSPRRRELVSSFGIPFTIIKPDIDEDQHPGEPPLDYVRRLSQEKAEQIIAQGVAPAIVLPADTVVILAADTIGIEENGEILGKPVDVDDARLMLQRLRGRMHQVCTAMTLVSIGLMPETSRQTTLTCTNVYMRDYTDAEIDAYIATGDPFDKAGSYAIQHAGFHPVERIEGCYTNVVGLPVCALKRMLAVVMDFHGKIAPEPQCDCEPITF